MDKDTRGIGDNSKQETNYKTLFESIIGMILEPKINIDTYLKDHIETARTATRLADKFEALHDAEAVRAIYEDRLNTLEYFRDCSNWKTKPADLKYMLNRLHTQWGTQLHDHYRNLLKEDAEVNNENC